jgi:hypothetical protein
MDKRTLHRFLPSSINIDARGAYRSLERHFKINTDCARCTHYHQYGVMLVKGDRDHLYDHLSNIANVGRKKVIAQIERPLDQIIASGLLTIEERENRLYEIVFTQLAQKEVLA